MSQTPNGELCQNTRIPEDFHSNKIAFVNYDSHTGNRLYFHLRLQSSFTFESLI